MAAGHREAARSVLDGGEHGARLNLDFSWFPTIVAVGNAVPINYLWRCAETNRKTGKRTVSFRSGTDFL